MSWPWSCWVERCPSSRSSFSKCFTENDRSPAPARRLPAKDEDSQASDLNAFDASEGEENGGDIVLEALDSFSSSGASRTADGSKASAGTPPLLQGEHLLPSGIQGHVVMPITVHPLAAAAAQPVSPLAASQLQAATIQVLSPAEPPAESPASAAAGRTIGTTTAIGAVLKAAPRATAPAAPVAVPQPPVAVPQPAQGSRPPAARKPAGSRAAARPNSFGRGATPPLPSSACGFTWIEENRIGGMCAPMSAGELQLLFRDLNVGAVVVLTETDETTPLVRAAGVPIRTLHLPVRDYMPPTLEHIQQFIEFDRTSYFETRRATSIHCMAGRGRTGVLLAAWLCAHKGLSAAAAVDLVRFRRPRSIETKAQEAVIFAFAATLGIRPRLTY